LLFEVLGGLAFFVSMAWYFLLEWRGRRRAPGGLAGAARPQQ
jgi:hypothetical protein